MIKVACWSSNKAKDSAMVQRPPWHHLQDSPPPPEIHDRVIQREDDTPETSLWSIPGSVLVSPAAAPRMIHQTSIDAVESVLCGYHSFDKDIGHEGIASYAFVGG